MILKIYNSNSIMIVFHIYFKYILSMINLVLYEDTVTTKMKRVHRIRKYCYECSSYLEVKTRLRYITQGSRLADMTTRLRNR